MANYGIKISQAGYDVSSANLRQLIISSQYPFLKAYSQGSFSLSITGPGTYTQEIAHNFGYPIKFVHYFSVDPTATSNRFLGIFGADAPFGTIACESWQDSNKIYIAWEDTSDAPGGFKTYPYTVYGYYYLFYDSIT